jgi:Ca2+-binding RTX toxin-like protein
MATLTNPANYQDIDGILWGWQWSPNQSNGHTALYYSFPTSSAAYGYSVSGFEAFNAAQQAAATRALANYDAVCNLDFYFTADGASGNVRFAMAETFSFGGFTWSGTTAYGLAPDDAHVVLAAQGDTWFNHTSYDAPEIGSFAYACGILHEVGHALGLKHGQDAQVVYDANGNLLYTNPALPAAHDGLEYSVMTYHPYPGASPTLDLPDEAPSTLMQDDILALQWMYGANYAYNSGDTTYRWDSETGEMSVNGVGMGVPFNNKILMTVWDGGGNDTYDFSNFATPVTVDLRPGGWSTPSQAMLADLDYRANLTHYAQGSIANALVFAGDYHGYIENAIGGSGNDVITGNVLGNELRGNAGNDTLDGGTGSDVLIGGAGNDTYYTDGGDTITETAEAGNDTVWSSVTYALGANLENVVLTGDAAINATGNALSNLILGNSAANVLNGGTGADSLNGSLGNDTYYTDGGDTIFEAAMGGTDTVRSTVSYALGANLENLILMGTLAINGTGNALANFITGNSSANVLNGGTGADKLAGGAGNDTYITDGGDSISEAANAGTDTVRSSASYALGSNLENLVLSGAAALNGTGNALANIIAGNGSANVLDGATGNDIIDGGAGNDKLIGGAGTDILKGGLGNDAFVFNAALGASNNDTLVDFDVPRDTIQLENAIFSRLAGTGILSSAQFFVGASAHDSDDRVIYNAASGALIYDSNGSASGGAVQFATLAHGLHVTNADFFII